MSQILKLADGNLVKNKKNQDLDQIAANRLKIQQAYDSGQLTADQKAQLDMISQNAQSYLSADPLHNRNARKFQLELTNRMADIVDGKQGYNPYSTEVADKDWFGNYKDHEMGLIANELIRQTLVGQTMLKEGMSNYTSMFPGTSSSVVIDDNNPTQYNAHHVYSWKNKAFDLLPEGSSIKDRVKLVAEGLKENVLAARQAEPTKTIHGIDSGKLKTAAERITRLDEILNNIKTNQNYSDRNSFDDLMQQIQDGTFNIDQDEFKQLFSEYYNNSSEPDLSTKEKRKNYILGKQYKEYTGDLNLINFAKSKGLNLFEFDNNIYAFNDEYQPYDENTKFGYLQDDFTKEGYGNALFVTADGRVHYGPITGENALQRDIVGTDLYDQIINKAKTDAQNKYNTYQYDKTLLKSEVLDNIQAALDQATIDPELKTLIQAELNHKKLEFADLSYYYKGNDIVLGITNSDETSPMNNGEDPLGLNWNKHFVIRYNPDNKKYSFELFNPEQYVNKGADDFKSRNQFIDKTGNIFNINFMKDIVPYSQEEFDGKLVGKSIKGEKINTREDAVNWILNNWNNTQGYAVDTFNNTLGNDKQKIARSIWNMYRLGQIQLQESQVGKLIDIISELGIKAKPSAKNGGVLYAKQGSSTYEYKLSPEYQEELNNKGKTKPELNSDWFGTSKHDDEISQAYGQEKISENFSGVDIARAVMLALDMAALGTSFAPTYGTAASGILSGVATVGDFVTDLVDKSVTTKDAFKLAGTGLGLTVAAMAPGGGTAKVLRGLIRFAPKFLAISQFLDDNTRQAWEKVGKGKFDDITRDDYKTLLYSLRNISGAGRSVAQKVNVQRRYVGEGTKTGNKLLKTTTGKSVTMTPENIKSIEEAGKNGGSKAAQTKFQEILKQNNVNEPEKMVLANTEQYGENGTRGNKLDRFFRRTSLKAEDEIKRGDYEQAVYDYFNENPYKTEGPWSETGKTKHPGKMLSWLPSDYLLANNWWFSPKELPKIKSSRTRFKELQAKKAAQSAQNRSNSTQSQGSNTTSTTLTNTTQSTQPQTQASAQQPVSSSNNTQNQSSKNRNKKKHKRQDGGRLDRLNNYLNKK